MKNRLNILVLLTLLVSSCSWLDITPSNIVTEPDLFSEAAGFHNAVNGLYRGMAQPQLYGREMTYGFSEVLSQNYVKKSSYGQGIGQYSPYYTLFDYDYTGSQDVKDIIEGIWSNSYNVIANANNIIANIGKMQPSDFTKGQEEINLVKGEALAVRAMLHFDILRLFAPAPVTGDKGAYIPYVTEFPYYGGQAKETVESVLSKVEKDLLEAKELIASYDTDSENIENLLEYNRFTLGTGVSNSNAFYEYRGYRINVIAVTGLLARLYNYWGKHEEAFKYAKEAADFKVSETSMALTYSNNRQTQYDRKFTTDLIFTLSSRNMFSDYLTYAASAGNSFLNMNKKMVMFESTPEADPGDNRFQYLVDTKGRYGYAPLKFVELVSTQSITSRGVDMIPLMRLSEMHLIMAEAKAAEGNFGTADGANYYMNLLREGRNCKTMDLGMTDMASFKAQLFREVRREFFNEGLTFFYFKKYNELLTSKMVPEMFVVPTPDSENIN